MPEEVDSLNCESATQTAEPQEEVRLEEEPVEFGVQTENYESPKLLTARVDLERARMRMEDVTNENNSLHQQLADLDMLSTRVKETIAVKNNAMNQLKEVLAVRENEILDLYKYVQKGENFSSPTPPASLNLHN